MLAVFLPAVFHTVHHPLQSSWEWHTSTNFVNLKLLPQPPRSIESGLHEFCSCDACMKAGLRVFNLGASPQGGMGAVFVQCC